MLELPAVNTAIRTLTMGVAAWAALGMSGALADAQATDDRGYVSFIAENDLFWGGTDRHFTNGFRLDWVPKDPWRVFGLGPLMNGLVGGDPGTPARTYFQLGQNMYTPNDLARADVVTGDRPYAGWLYATMGSVRHTARQTDRLELTLGIVGPSSLAGDLQRRWHDLFNFDQPSGWPNQLRDEPGIVLFYERQWRPLTYEDGSWKLELSPHLNAALGNVFTYAGAGVTVRFGYNIPRDGGPPRIRFGLPGAAQIRPRAGAQFGWYVFAGVEGRAVARNIFIDGNTFTKSHSVPGKTLVGDGTVGLAVIAGETPVQITFSFTWRSKEFDGQDGPDRFGSISITMAY